MTTLDRITVELELLKSQLPHRQQAAAAARSLAGDLDQVCRQIQQRIQVIEREIDLWTATDPAH